MKTITEKRKLGNLGEDLACRFLIKQGFDIIDRNYLKKCGEIDIVTKKDNVLHFIEVKSVSCEMPPNVSSSSVQTGKIGEYRPEDNVHSWKLQRLAKTIQIYIIEKSVSDETDWQLDVITVYIDKKRLVSKIHTINNVII